MTIDETIKNLEETAIEEGKLCKQWDEYTGNIEEIRPSLAKYFEKCAAGHRQLVEWLKELKQKRWIPCSERFPEKHGGYLVTVKQGYVTTAIWLGNNLYWNNVIAWMPLPEEYKPESREEE